MIAFSSGYCLYDIYVCLVEIKFTLDEAKDYIFHHVVGIMGALGVMICGRFTVALSAGNLVSELSNALMNVRWRLLKHKQTEHWAFVPASVTFMICFFFSRVVFMLMLIIRLVDAHHVFDIRNEEPYIIAAYVATDALQVMLYLLQIYWFQLIFMNFYKTVTGGFKVRPDKKGR